MEFEKRIDDTLVIAIYKWIVRTIILIWIIWFNCLSNSKRKNVIINYVTLYKSLPKWREKKEIFSKVRLENLYLFYKNEYPILEQLVDYYFKDKYSKL